MTKNSIFFNHSFEKKRLKALISWIHKTFGEKEALRVVDELKVMGFTNATRAGLSIGLHDLITPPEKPLLLSKAQVAMNKTDQDFKGGKITATERSQRIIDTWHRTSDTLRKQVVDHFNTYDQLNSVYIMALSGARGNFSQVRQLIGMRGLMADPQGQIISFPIRSNFREGLTLTEYFISCSGARKGLVDTALRTADTGYLTRRLVDVSHQVVIKRVACNTSRGIVLQPLQTGPVGGTNKIMLSLKDRLIGRVLAEDITVPNMVFERNVPETPRSDDFTYKTVGFVRAPYTSKARVRFVAASKRTALANRKLVAAVLLRQSDFVDEQPEKFDDFGRAHNKSADLGQGDYNLMDDHNLNRLSHPASNDRAYAQHTAVQGRRLLAAAPLANRRFAYKTVGFVSRASELAAGPMASTGARERSYRLATRDTEISPNLAFKIAGLRDRVVVRSSLTCACTHEVCQLCYGWSLSQGKLVSLGEAVGVIAAQSIGEPGTQLTMRTFHTGGVFSGDLLQDIRAPHAGKVFFPEALQGLLVRTAQGQIAFLIKIPGALLLDDGKGQVTRIQLEAATMVFVRQGEVIESNTVIGELAVITKEGNQPIKSRQTLFAEFGGRVTHHLGRTLKVHKPEMEDEPLSAATRWYDGEELDLVKDAEKGRDRLKNGFRFIEPTHSLSLGVFRILATRIGAKESDLSKVRFIEPKFRFSEPYQQPDTALGTLANLRFIDDDLRANLRLHSEALPDRSSGYPLLAERSSVGPLHSEAVQGLGFQAAEGLQGRFSPAPTASKSKAGGLKTDGFVRQSKALHANLRFAKRSADLLQIEDLHGSNCRPTFGLLRQGSIQSSMPERISPPAGLSQTTVLQNRFVIVDSISTGCFATVPEKSNSLSSNVIKSSVNELGPSGLPIASANRSPARSLANRRLAANFRLVAASKRSYVLNTIAEEGDLVDENYKDCASSFQ